MKLAIRYFSIGLLTASIVLFIMYLIVDDTSQAIEDLSVEELATALEDKGYRTITQDEFISYSVYRDEQKEAEEKKESEKAKSNKASKDDSKDKVEEKEEKNRTDEKKQETKKDEKEKKKPKTATITVKEGSVTQDIGKELEKEGIVKDANEFVKYMEDNDYSSRIQIGKFKVNSDMSLKQLAETFTTYPGS